VANFRPDFGLLVGTRRWDTRAPRGETLSFDTPIGCGFKEARQEFTKPSSILHTYPPTHNPATEPLELATLLINASESRMPADDAEFGTDEIQLFLVPLQSGGTRISTHWLL
jgi:hypothetical protein